jgi:hypothetical protein
MTKKPKKRKFKITDAMRARLGPHVNYAQDLDAVPQKEWDKFYKQPDFNCWDATEGVKRLIKKYVK